jgi:agmatinase
MYTRTLLPGFAGIASFLRAPQGSVEALQPDQIAVLGLPNVDSPDGRPLTATGPGAVREVSAAFAAELQADPRHEFVDIESGRRLRFKDPLPVADLGDFSPLADQSTMLSAALQEQARGILATRALAVFLGGGRAVSAPLVSGCSAALPAGRRLAYIQLTCSLGLGTPSGPLDSGATVSTILAQKAVREEDIAWLGPHGYVALPEWDRARGSGGALKTADDLAGATAAEVARTALQPILARCDAVYLTLDVSVVDTGSAPGTADLRVGGLDPSQALAVAGALSDLPLVAVDLVEIVPSQDASGRAERLGFELVLQALGRRLT